MGIRRGLPPPRTTGRHQLSAKTLGVLAVVGVVVGFSLSSTLVKRADTPGVLIALWRMVAVSVLWNLLLWQTGRRVTRADVRQVWLPGVFFGLAIAVLFGAVTRNSIANAALIGALAPFLIVWIGAWRFGEYFSWPAIGFAVIAFGGVALVLLSAPPGGDATVARQRARGDRDAADGRLHLARPVSCVGRWT